MTQPQGGQPAPGTPPAQDPAGYPAPPTDPYGQPVQPDPYGQPVQPQRDRSAEVAAEAARFNRRHLATPETKEFWRTSEFALWFITIIGVAIGAGTTNRIFDAHRAWTLITILSIGYIVSRGLSKALIHRGNWNYGTATHGQSGFEQFENTIRTPETKEFFKTSEFMIWALTFVALLIGAGVAESFDAGGAWTSITYLTVAYMVSRGLAKAGSRRDASQNSGSRNYTQASGVATVPQQQPGVPVQPRTIDVTGQPEQVPPR